MPLLLLLLIVFGSSPAGTFENDCECLQYVAAEYEVLGYAYQWGDWDCSKFVEQILTDCGIQVERCRSIDYAHGRCGFRSVIVPVDLRDSCDFAFWTWPDSDRTFGHTGMFEHAQNVYHNSGKAGRVVKAPVRPGGYLLRALKRVRRLSPGE
ncbi:MAG: hypothetical protein RDU20_18390 [Desulfomonilaceae bacterium]|nr:hypothetical protein [Desulfomonilaceae bacterium]